MCSSDLAVRLIAGPGLYVKAPLVQNVRFFDRRILTSEPCEPERFVPERMESMYVDPLPVLQTHALAVASLPMLHRDPFDRLLVAQATVEGIPIISRDPQVARYDVELIRA